MTSSCMDSPPLPSSPDKVIEHSETEDDITTNYHKPSKLPAEEELNYPAKTIPRDSSSSRLRNRKSSPAQLEFSTKTSFEQTQSEPTISARHSEGSAVDDHLATLNEALSQLHQEANPRPKKRSGRIVRRLSYVERSYHQLDNDDYYDMLDSATNTLDLDHWAS